MIVAISKRQTAVPISGNVGSLTVLGFDIPGYVNSIHVVMNGFNAGL